MIKRFIYLYIVSIEWECCNLNRIMVCSILY
nr:MAG TPA: hypothetical protein [Caudoviricetes sp.]DAX58403.1 MAG TPA: hypothetical protein [Caudoviricetes sp.]